MSKRRKKWHDLTMGTGDPQDLPIGGGEYMVTIGDRTSVIAFDPYDDFVITDWDSNVIAWRKKPKPFVPGQHRGKRS